MTTTHVKTLALILAACAIPALVSAQTAPPSNRFRVSFTSPDHAVMTRYEMGFFLAGAAEPVQNGGLISLGLPGPDASGAIIVLVDARPVAIGQYELKVRGVQIANGQTFYTAWGRGPNDTVVPFSRVLLPPADLRTLP